MAQLSNAGPESDGIDSKKRANRPFLVSLFVAVGTAVFVVYMTTICWHYVNEIVADAGDSSARSQTLFRKNLFSLIFTTFLTGSCVTATLGYFLRSNRCMIAGVVIAFAGMVLATASNIVTTH